jgi:hypothetical protein
VIPACDPNAVNWQRLAIAKQQHRAEARYAELQAAVDQAIATHDVAAMDAHLKEMGDLNTRLARLSVMARTVEQSAA